MMKKAITAAIAGILTAALAAAVSYVLNVVPLPNEAPTLNLENPQPADVPGIAHVTLAESFEGERPLRSALCNSFGFGGVNVCLHFQRWEE